MMKLLLFCLIIFALPALAGTSNVIFILTKFTDTAAENFTQQAAQDEVNATVSFFAEASYGRQLLSATVTPWLVAQMPTSPNCDLSAVSIAADAAAVAAGYVLSRYERRYYVMAPSGRCGFEGMTDQAPPYRIWNNGQNSRRVYSHELGHSFGLMHAGRVAKPGPAQGVDEYGDWYSAMGATYLSHFNAVQKAKLGWILPTEVATFNGKAAAGTTATYTLTPLEKAGGATYAVKISTPSFQRTYWVEYRQALGVDAYVAQVSGAAPGVQIRLSPPFESPSWRTDSQVFDTGAGHRQALPVGSTYVDSYGISVKVLSADATQARVQVTTSGLAVIPTTTGLTAAPNPSAAGQRIVY